MPTFTLSQIIIYPVKSLGGVKLTEAHVEARGLELDRRWMLTDPNGKFLTQREFPRLALVSPSVEADCLLLAGLGMTTLRVPLRTDGPTQPVQVLAQRLRSCSRWR